MTDQGLVKRLQLASPFSGHLDFLFFSSVTNHEEINDYIKAGKLSAAFLNPELIVDEFQILIATGAALEAKSRNGLITKSIHSEIIYRLAATRNIREALATYGINWKIPHLLVVIVNGKPDEIEAICKVIKGKQEVSYNPSNYCNINKIKKQYGITEDEITSDNPNKSLLDAIVTKIIVKHI